MKIRIPNAEVQQLLSGKEPAYPKYATQIMNLANQNAQGTRPSVVGQMSDLIQEFDGSNIADWETWYLERYPNAIDVATERVFAMVELLKKSIVQIDEKCVRQWLEDLVITKTYCGLKFQDAILQKVAAAKGQAYRLATPEEEAKGIDGYVGETPVSIKPVTYKIKNQLPEHIDYSMIYYDKKKPEIVVECDF